MKKTTVEQLDFVTKEILKIEKGTSHGKRTSGNLVINGQSIDIDKPKSISDLIIAGAAVGQRKVAYDASAETLGLTSYPAFEISGATAEQWMNDIKLAVNIFKNKSKLSKLKEIQSELKSCITKEERKKKAEDDLAKLLEDDGTLKLN